MTISVRLNDKDTELVKAYAEMNANSANRDVLFWQFAIMQYIW